MIPRRSNHPENGDKHSCDIDLQLDCRELHFSKGEDRLPQTGGSSDQLHSFTIRDTPLSRVTEEQTMNRDLMLSVVDDDESVRESLPELLKTFGYASKAFSSAEAFLESAGVEDTACLILDIGMPGISGPALQQELKKRKISIPIIFITAQRDETLRSNLIRQGAIDCLYKPFSETELLNALNSALT